MTLRLKELRLQENHTQTEISKLLGISREAYSMYESGKRQPSLETLDILASFYQISVDYLIGRTDFPAPAKPLTTEEEQILQQYRTLDARGKQVLAALAALESTYSKSTE